MRTGSLSMIATFIVATSTMIESSGPGGQGNDTPGTDRPAFGLLLQEIEFSTPRLVDGGTVTVRVTATALRDVEPRSCSGLLTAAYIHVALRFTSCSARRTGPSRYELVLVRAFPRAVVNRAFHLGSIELAGVTGERYASNHYPEKTVEVVSTAVVPDVRNARVQIRPDGHQQLWFRPHERFRLDLYVDSATPIEAGWLRLSLFPREGRGVDATAFAIHGDRYSTPGWIERVQHNRVGATHFVTVFATVPQGLREMRKVEVHAAAINQSLQFFEAQPTGIELEAAK